MDTRRRVRLLLSVTLLVLVANLIGLVTTEVLIEDHPTVEFIFALPCLTAVVLSIPCYIIGRSSRYRIGAVLLVITVALLGYSAMIVTPGPSAVNYVAIAPTSTLIASLFLSIRLTGLLGTAVVFGMWMTMALHTPVTYLLFASQPHRLGDPLANYNMIISVIIALAMTGVILLSMRLRDLLEADRLAARTRALEQEALAEAYKRAESVKSTFLASMSHELRTPLNTITSFARLVASQGMGPVNDEQIFAMNEVESSAVHLLRLINDVLDMSKIEAGALRLFVEANIDLQPIIDSISATAKTLLAEKPVELRVNIVGVLPAVLGDRQRIYQVLLNMISNACKFTEQGLITLRAESLGDKILFAITDTGPGIAPEDQPFVFDPFRQTSTGLRKGGGTGLGMSISRRLAEAHDGRLWFESTPGSGSTFYFALPVRSPALLPLLASQTTAR
ncbi:MAG: hypothetical protein JNJ61_26005 [Anaerolineae bacterium]|nr:hypothetical protein [Anaerolineae bacterium]